MFDWRRARSTLYVTVPIGLLLGLSWESGPFSALIRCVTLGCVAMLACGLLERWPKRLPRWVTRWVLQVIAVAVVMPPTTAILYALSTPPGAPPFYEVPARMEGFGALTVIGMFIAP